MSKRYDAIVIGAGLGGLTAAGLLAKSGRKVLVIERNKSVGGAASTYKVGDLTVEASLHETGDPRHPGDAKHQALARLGLLDAVEWVPVGSIFEVRGGPVGGPFVLPDNFAKAREALGERFPAARDGFAAILGEMEQLTAGLGTLMRGREAFDHPLEGLSGLAKLWPMVGDWQRSLAEILHRHLGANEAAKFALAANLGYYHDDPATMWWIFFTIAQGGYLQSGGYYVRGGSQNLSNALASAVTASGGEILLGRAATAIRLDGNGAVRAVVHGSGSDEAEAEAPVILGNAAPLVLGGMLPEAARERFLAPYAGRPLSLTLFSAVYGLSVPGRELGIRSYSTFLVPDWMNSMAQYGDNARVMAGLPGKDAPGIMVVDYSQIDAGLGGPPFPIGVVGVDRLENWATLDNAAYEDKRKRWADAVIAQIDREFPGFASHIVVSEFSTPRSLARYLNSPGGAIYGFAPRPPAGPIWKGVERSSKTAVAGLYLASAYAGTGGFTGTINASAGAADAVIAAGHAGRR